MKKVSNNNSWSPYQPNSNSRQRKATFNAFQKTLGGGIKGKNKQIVYYVTSFDETRRFFSSNKAFKFAEVLSQKTEVTVERKIYTHSIVRTKKSIVFPNSNNPLITSLIQSMIDELDEFIYKEDLENSTIILNRLIARLGVKHLALSDIIREYNLTQQRYL